MTHYDVTVDGTGLIATEITDANPNDQTQVYDLVAGEWVLQ